MKSVRILTEPRDKSLEDILEAVLFHVRNDDTIRNLTRQYLRDEGYEEKHLDGLDGTMFLAGAKGEDIPFLRN